MIATEKMRLTINVGEIELIFWEFYFLKWTPKNYKLKQYIELEVWGTLVFNYDVYTILIYYSNH